MKKVDFKKSLSSYSAKSDKFEIITVPRMQYLMIDGRGDPNTSQEFADALATLYPVAYALKFASKTEQERDYTVMPLEGLWWSDDMTTFTTARDKSKWSWTMMIMQPDWITKKMVDAAIEKVRAKSNPSSLHKMRLESLDEGQSVQTLHIGSFDDEGPVLARLHNEFMPKHGLQVTHKHHEIYLSDMRRVAPDKLRTILRQPVTGAHTTT